MLQPEKGALAVAESPKIRMPVFAFVGHETTDAERFERCFVKPKRAFHITNGQENVIEHLFLPPVRLKLKSAIDHALHLRGGS
ncbi:hypothetical protein [Paraburkholderia youngii]|uniref:hypothetical protein n=1 Tax=Paraburkholderia youngii TaxID=2782701 RepID=UPI0015935FAF|nr:hypothetical protein [Paraburkholderia youngii]